VSNSSGEGVGPTVFASFPLSAQREGNQMKHPYIALCHATLLIIAFAFAEPSWADDQGYIDNWAGKVKLELQIPRSSSAGFEVIQLPDAVAPSPLSDWVGFAWARSREKVCNRIREKLHLEGAVREWRSCDLAMRGELRGYERNPSLYPNQLELKYVVTGNAIMFRSPAPFWLIEVLLGDPLVVVEFDVVLRLTLTFSTTLDGRNLPTGFETEPIPSGPPNAANPPYLLGPAKMPAAVLTTEKAKVLSTIAALPGAEDKIRDAERKFNASIEQLSPEDVDLRASNLSLHKGAIDLTRVVSELRPNQGTFYPYFYLKTFLNPEQDFVIRFTRLDPPAAPPGCRCTELCDHRVTCNCAGAQLFGHTTTVFHLHRLMPNGTWVFAGRSEVWSVEGNSFGAVDGETLTYRVCAIDTWGDRCSDPITFSYRDIGPCTASGGGGGGSRPGLPCVRGLFGIRHCRPLQ
jgi:hypothetical protein